MPGSRILLENMIEFRSEDIEDLDVLQNDIVNEGTVVGFCWIEVFDDPVLRFARHLQSATFLGDRTNVIVRVPSSSFKPSCW